MKQIKINIEYVVNISKQSFLYRAVQYLFFHLFRPELLVFSVFEWQLFVNEESFSVFLSARPHVWQRYMTSSTTMIPMKIVKAAINILSVTTISVDRKAEPGGIVSTCR